ncbi:hypothetical protein BDV98DRAFT_570372 [Pterulicium gracile]|uniref:Extracellular membrane protein CFEM domain-containing protein n=1 Tax=Pterulicium gracile TaxID=1884261 RepID=A0A5C3QDX3_9AGAR|nr:hypothetical protein BDV98DRAFT_570372 [Pterula gracilis]
MVSYVLCLTPLVLLAASQGTLSSALATTPSLRLRSLAARQTVDEDFPPECAATCGAMDASFGSVSCSTDSACICTNENFLTYSECMNCLLSGVPASSAESVAQQGNEAIGPGAGTGTSPGTGTGTQPGGGTGAGVGGGSNGGGDNDPAGDIEDDLTSPPSSGKPSTPAANDDKPDADADGAAVGLRGSSGVFVGAAAVLMIML